MRAGNTDPAGRKRAVCTRVASTRQLAHLRRRAVEPDLDHRLPQCHAAT
jgi:hypothetical protein